MPPAYSPDGPRPAVVFTVRVAGDGAVKLDGAERAIIRSRAKLAYTMVTDADLPAGFTELSRRIQAAEQARGASRVDPPEQEVAALPGGGYALTFRPRLESEASNAAMSLATNMAVADMLMAHHTGLFRVMPEPDAKDVARLRHTAHALAIDWRTDMSLTTFEQLLDANDPRDAAMMIAVRRAGGGASYAPFHDGETPWHAAMAATYAHATAPLRRLADRYVVQAALAICRGEPVPEPVTAAFDRLPKIMARAGSTGHRIDSAVIDLAEVVMLKNRVGETFDAVVTNVDDRGASVQLRDLPIVDRIAADHAAPGDTIKLRLTSANVAERRLSFERTR